MKIIKNFGSILIFIIAALLLFSACGLTEPEDPMVNATQSPEISPTEEPTPSPTGMPEASPTAAATEEPVSGPSAIGLYIPAEGSRDRKLLTEFTGPWEMGKDIDCFETIASNEELLTGGSFKDIWETCWYGYPDADGYKIGYILSFTLNSSEVITKTIRSPKDIDDFTQYIEVYLYDDVHQQNGVRYTHLSESEINEETVCTSIKLTAGEKISEVEEIMLTAFVYGDEGDFDPGSGNYIGSVYYEIPILKSR